jgi:hypothetical protein
MLRLPGEGPTVAIRGCLDSTLFLTGPAIAHRGRIPAGRVFVLDRQKSPTEIERILCAESTTGQPIAEYARGMSYGKLDHRKGPRATPTNHARTAVVERLRHCG